MQPSSNDISFSLFGFPTTIQPFFWLIAAIIPAVSLGVIDNMPMWIIHVLIGMAAILISILAHELGHALTFRHVFHTPCAIVLHGFGGLATPLQHYSRGYGFRGAVANCFLAFSGPLAGFVLGSLMLLLLFVVPRDDSLASSLLIYFLTWMVWIAIVWGIFNLLPIYPMDGGHISREVFLFFSPRQGIKLSLILSIAVAILLAVLAFRLGMLFAAFFCVFFAYQNYQEMNFRS